jgi:non-ribosomal peptide synthetase component E (peptide arylation enzyme)
LVPQLGDLESRRAALEEQHRPWRSLTLVGTLDRVVSAYPDRTFVIGEHASYTYGALAAWATRLARGLVGRGVETGDRGGTRAP